MLNARRLVGFFLLAGAMIATAISFVGGASAHTGHTFTIEATASGAEGNSGTGSIDVTVTVSSAAQPGETLKVQYGVQTGGGQPATPGASSPADFQAIAGELDFSLSNLEATTPDPTTEVVSVPVFGDTTDELNETFIVELTNPLGTCASAPCTTSSATLGSPKTSTVTITDDDDPVEFSISGTVESGGTTPGNITEGTSPAVKTGVFTISKSGPTAFNTSVQFRTAQDPGPFPPIGAHNPAEPGSDYVHIAGQTVTFAPGETSKQVSVQMVEDSRDEENETFLAQLANPSNATISSSNGEVVATIVDDDGLESVNAFDATAKEGDPAGAPTSLSFKVGLSEASGKEITVDYATSNGTATAGSDYAGTSGTLTFAPGETQKFVNVTIVRDEMREGNETVNLTLSNVSATGTPGDMTAVGTITDDDNPELSVSDATRSEGGTITFTITLSKPTAAVPLQDAKVNYATSDSLSADDPTDYTGGSGQVTIPPSTSQTTVSFPTHEDGANEGNERFILNLSKPASCCQGGFDYTIKDGQAIGTITDDDPSHDFNGDGRDDAVFGIPGDNVGAAGDAGSVSVIYGTPTGLNAATPADQVWNLQSTGVTGTSASGDRLGSAVTTGDFNRDGFGDLAAGAPGKVGGAVLVLYGSNTGLTATGSQLWTQSNAVFENGSETVDRFGSALCAGDFDKDGSSDLAIGAPGESLGAVSNAGAVGTLYGSSGGINTTNSLLLHQNSPGVPGSNEKNDRFGSSLACGDTDRDNFDDLAIGSPLEDVGAKANAGTGYVLFGGATGVVGAGGQQWNQNSNGIADLVEAEDQFASAVAIGDFSGNGIADVAFAAPGEDLTRGNVGAVHILYSTTNGPGAAKSQFWHQDVAGVLGGGEAGDLFGSALGVGDFDGDTFDDLAIGVRGEAIGKVVGAGSTTVLYGAVNGVNATGDQLWVQGSGGLQGAAEANDHFGQALSSGDFNGDGRADLLAAAPDEDIDSATNAGVAHAIYGAAGAGLKSSGNQQWHENSAEVLGTAGGGDQFGLAVR